MRLERSPPQAVDDASADDWLAALDAAFGSRAYRSADWMPRNCHRRTPRVIFDAAEQARRSAGDSDEDWLDSLREASGDGLLTLEPARRTSHLGWRRTTHSADAVTTMTWRVDSPVTVRD